MTTEPPSDAVQQAVDELRAQSSATTVTFTGDRPYEGGVLVAVELDTTSFTRVDGGLPVNPRERLLLEITRAYPRIPPIVHVDHHRWDGYPHVLQGSRLCLYLDPASEWNPADRIEGFLHRLWDWFDDAIANRFDPTTALYQPVGGVFHRTAGAPTIIVNEPIAIHDASFHIGLITLAPRTDHRIDISSWQRTGRADGTITGVVVVLSDGLPHGGGHYLSDLAVAIRGQDSRNQRRQFLAEVTKATRHLTRDQHLHVLIAVPNRHLTGEARHHLIGWRLPRNAVTGAVMAAKDRHKEDAPHPDHEPKVEWTFVDDNRPAISTRRDHARPISWFAGKTIELWGCGALGSCLAEQLVRANAAKITLRDGGYVIRGLLARQNYMELDVGRSKVDALADRLRKLSDDADVVAIQGDAQLALVEPIEADLIIDCTVNTAVTVAIDEQQRDGILKCPVVQLATDNATTTLAIVTITTDNRISTIQLDQSLEEKALNDDLLAPFRAFWQRDNHPSLTPTLGCSAPTFHGSSSDAMSVAASAITLASHALSRGVATGYLFATAHSPYDTAPRTTVTVHSSE